jgi:pyrroline-5-carboxylate reductase
MILGFIGTGGITEAIVKGLCNHGGHDTPILVSRRNRDRSRRLAEAFDLVEVVDDNQDIVDRSDWIVISVLPGQALDLLSSLRFRDDHLVISLPAGITLDTVAERIRPATRVCRAIPMPPVEFGLGPTPVCPPNSGVQALFNGIGAAVAVEDERQFTALAASTAIMATFFDWIASNASWLESQNVPAKEAAFYTTSVFHALAAMAARVDAESLRRISQDCLTPGGLNEQVLNAARAAGVIETIQNEIGRVMERLEDTAQWSGS